MAKGVRYANCKIDWNKIKNNRGDSTKSISCILDYLIAYAKELNFNHHPEDLNKVMTRVNSLISKLENEELPAVYQHLKKTQETIAKRLKNTPRENRNNNANIMNLKFVIDNIEAIMSSVDLRVVDVYKGSSYEFFKYIITTNKNVDIVEMTLEKYPHFVNLRSEDGKETLIDAIVDEYLRAIDTYAKEKELTNTYEIFYCDNILRKIISHPKFKDYSLNKEENSDKIRTYKEAANKYNSIYPIKSQIIYWLNQLSDCINKKELKMNYESLKFRTDVHDGFDEGVLSEVNQYTDLDFKTNYDSYINDEVFAITIDKEGTLDKDDAISISKNEDGSYKLGVHIADPLAIITADSIIFDEALNRTTTILLGGNGRIPMFPEELTQNLLTLSTRRYNHVNSYYMNINKKGEVESYYFAKEKIKIAESFSYNDMNNLIMTKSNSKIGNEMIENLLELRSCLTKSTKKDELYEKIKQSDSNISDTNITESGNSQEIINLTMLITNKTVAKFFSENNYPFLYRNHIVDTADTEELEYYQTLLAGEANSAEYLRAVKNIYPSPFYSLVNSGHHGLKAQAYCHITSPLRRLADLINDECLNLLYYKMPSEEDFIEVEELVNKGSKQLKAKTKQLEIFRHEYNRMNRNKAK